MVYSCDHFPLNTNVESIFAYIKQNLVHQLYFNTTKNVGSRLRPDMGVNFSSCLLCFIKKNLKTFVCFCFGPQLVWCSEVAPDCDWREEHRSIEPRLPACKSFQLLPKPLNKVLDFHEPLLSLLQHGSVILLANVWLGTN